VLRLREQGQGGTLELDAAALDVPMLGLSGRVEWRCTLAGAGDGSRACEGPARLHSTDGREQTANLAARVAQDRVALSVSHEEASVAIELPIGGDAPTRATLAKVPASWLRVPLAQAWPNGELREGLVDAQADVHKDGAIDGHYGLAGATLNSVDGALSAESIDASGKFRISGEPAKPAVQSAATLTKGKLAFGEVRIALPETPVDVSIDAAALGDGRWNIADVRWRDAGTLEFGARCVFAPSAPDPLRELSVTIDHAVFPAASERYAKGLLAARGLSALQAKGALSGNFALGSTGIERLALKFDAFDASGGKRVAIKGLAGAIDWSATGERDAATIGWKSVTVDGHPIASAKISLRSREGMLTLAKPMPVRALGGTLTLDKLSFDPRVGDRLAATAAFGIKKIGYDSADGTIAAAGISADGTLRLDGTIAAPHVDMQTTFRGGELLYGAFYVKLPETPVKAALDANLADAGVHVERFEWNDSGVLEIEGGGDIAPKEAKPIATIDAELRRVDLAIALDRYAHSWLAAKGYAELKATGSVSGKLKWNRDGLERFAFATSKVDLVDGAGRFAFSGIDGGVDWRHGGDSPSTSLAWNAIELFRIPLGAARAQLRSQDGAIALAEPLSVGVLGGQVRLEKLSLQPRSPRGERYAGSFAIAGIDMTQLCAALGWPRFAGNLSGGIPEIELAGDTIELHGGLDLYVFDGYLGISGMTLERPFGIAPSLRADIHFERFDLEALTSAFSFGGMSGRLDGNVRELRLVDWSPVAFDASLRANGGGRMSYKAVNDLTALGGGGGLSSSLQTMALKVFDTFGYRRLGIRCKLAGEVCAMGGIESASSTGEIATADSGGDSYTIVEGSGLPRIEIVGHRRRVNWPTLVDRLIEATRGQGPIIQ